MAQSPCLVTRVAPSKPGLAIDVSKLLPKVDWAKVHDAADRVRAFVAEKAELAVVFVKDHYRALTTYLAARSSRINSEVAERSRQEKEAEARERARREDDRRARLALKEKNRKQWVIINGIIAQGTARAVAEFERERRAQFEEARRLSGFPR